MAHQGNPFKFIGCIGAYVGYMYKGKYCIRKRPVRKKTTVHLAQTIQNARFSKANKLVKSLSSLLATSIPEMKTMNKPNFVLSHIMKHAIHGDYPDFKIDYSLVPVSHGNLQPAFAETVASNSGSLIYTWQNIAFNNARENDNVILVAYYEALNQCFYSINSTVRCTGIATLPVKAFTGHEVHTWLAFKSNDGKLISRSTYTGALFVT